MFDTRYAIITEGDHKKLLAIADWIDGASSGSAKALRDIATRSVELTPYAIDFQERLPVAKGS